MLSTVATLGGAPASTSSKPDNLSSIASEATVDTPSFRWIGLRKVEWIDPNKQHRQWEYAFRTTRRSECDGVAILAFVKYPKSRKDDEVVLVTQFRPPLGAEVVEAPAGLIDGEEDPTVAAERELLEETGLSGKVTGISPIVYCDPGMSNANTRYVTIEVDGDADENQNPRARPDDGEFITVSRLPATGIVEGLEAMAEAGFKLDGRLYALAHGYALGRKKASAAEGAARGYHLGPGNRGYCLWGNKGSAWRMGRYAACAGVVIGAWCLGRCMGQRSGRQ